MRAYVTSSQNDRVTGFPLTASGDFVGAGVTTAAGDGPTGVAVNAAGTRLYVTNFLSATVQVFPLNASGDIAGRGVQIAAGGGAAGVALR